MQLSMSFERPTRGDTLRVEATIDNAGTSTLFASARLYDAQGQVCARCQGVVKVSQSKWASGESPAVN
jgi:acyl-coenzyme A thioesterase PaaI-like protein